MDPHHPKQGHNMSETSESLPSPPLSPSDYTRASQLRATSDLQSARRPHVQTGFSGSDLYGEMSPNAGDRVFPMRSVVSIDPSSTPAPRPERVDGYFHGFQREDTQRFSITSDGSQRRPRADRGGSDMSLKQQFTSDLESANFGSTRMLPQINSQIGQSIGGGSTKRGNSVENSETSRSDKGEESEIDPVLTTTRFKHVLTDDGHAIITGRGDELQRCEDEPIHIPGAIQSFGLLIALHDEEGKLTARVVSENSRAIIGYSPKQIFDLDNFTDILTDEQSDNFLDHIDFIRDTDSDIETNGPELFTMTIRAPDRKPRKLWCAMHTTKATPDLIICEFEMEDDVLNPLVTSSAETPDLPEDTLNSDPTEEELMESTQNISRPLRVLRSARKRKGEAAAMEVFNIMSQVQEQLAAAPSLEIFLKVLVGVVKELTGFHRVMVYQFDSSFNGRVVTELVDPRATKDLYKGLNFPASDIPKQARELYKINRVRLLYDRDQETARLVCRTLDDLETPLDLTHSFLRAMSPIHLKYLTNMAVRSSMSISINAFDELWGLVSCHAYGPSGMRVSFPIRKMCRLVGDTASRTIERLSYASRLQARKLINTAPTQHNPSGYIIASSEDLLKLFEADFGLLCIQDETKILGKIEQSQEALAMLEYLKARKLTAVTTSSDIKTDFPDLIYAPGFQVLAGMLLVPLSYTGIDFIAFFRRGQLKEVKWAGNPYEKVINEGTTAFLQPRKSFKLWSETVVGKCRDWTEEEIETAAVLCLVYGKFIEVWRQKEVALQSTQLTRLLLANSAHEVRTPLNAIINYLEIALEGTLDSETRENLAKSHSASKSLIYVINDLLDLTKIEEGGDLIKEEVFDLLATLREAADTFRGDAKRKNIAYAVTEHPSLPKNVIGDQRKVRQAVSNIIANAIRHTTVGGVKVDFYVVARDSNTVHVEIAVQDTGVGMSTQKLDALFRGLEQVSSDNSMPTVGNDENQSDSQYQDHNNALGLGLAVVARIVRNMNGQVRLKSEEGQGSRFIIQFPFELPDSEISDNKPGSDPVVKPPLDKDGDGEVTIVERGEDRPKSSASLHRLGQSRSNESLGSRNSARSIEGSGTSKTDVDRLIEAIQKPNLVDDGSSLSSGSTVSNIKSRPQILKRATHSGAFVTATENQARKTGDVVPTLEAQQPIDAHFSVPGQQSIAYSATPIKAVKVPEDERGPPTVMLIGRSGIMSEVTHLPSEAENQNDGQTEEPPITAENLNVLVAEDDPINSKILSKRLEKLGHNVFVTVNGEECAGAYEDRPAFFDVVLMDMQMPIVDGLTSTKMIRALEQSEPRLSRRAALNGRVPIIAVSASLVESNMKTYIDAGFDAWILKPLSFNRIQELLTGIVDTEVRSNALYTPGVWEKGGWFDIAKPKHIPANSTAQPPGGSPLRVDSIVAPESEVIEHTAKGKSQSMPLLKAPELPQDDAEEEERGTDNITVKETVASPAAIE